MRQELLGNRLRELRNLYINKLTENLGNHIDLMLKIRPQYIWVLLVLDTTKGNKTFFVEIQKVDDLGFRYMLTEAHLSIINDIILHINRALSTRITNKHTLFDKLNYGIISSTCK